MLKGDNPTVVQHGYNDVHYLRQITHQTVTMTTMESDRLDRMAQVVFNKENLRQLKEALDSLLDTFAEVLESSAKPSVVFSHTNVLERLKTIRQDKWKSIYNILVHDPFMAYRRGNFSSEEDASPAKIMLDFVNVIDRVGTDLKNKLEHYQEIVTKISKEKSNLEVSLSKAESRLRQERSMTSQEKLELKNARGSLVFWEGLVKAKNERIAELHRQQNVQLWEREKARIFAESEIKIKDLEKDLEDQKTLKENLTRRITQLEENIKMLRMKQDLTKGTLSSEDKSLEELKRSIYLLEKDVIFLEHQLYTQQRAFATVLCGLKTDFLILSDQMNAEEVPKSKFKEFAKLGSIASDVFRALLQGNLSETLKQLPPHYSYLPNEFKVKRVKRLSRPQLTPIYQSLKPDAGSAVSLMETNMDRAFKDSQNPEELIVENPRLIDPVSKTINSTRCMQYFPHMSQDSVKELWAKFQEFDVDGNEHLDFSEVIKALSSLGLQFTAQQAEEAMLEADINKSRTLDFYEYLVVSDKLFSRKGHSELFHTKAALESRRVMAKTCVLQ